MLFEWIEIAIVVKQGKTALDAKCCDPAIDDFANSESLGAELAIVDRALHGNMTPDYSVDREIREVPPHGAKFFIRGNAL